MEPLVPIALTLLKGGFHPELPRLSIGLTLDRAARQTFGEFQRRIGHFLRVQIELYVLDHEIA